DAARIPHTTDFYGPGTHSWPYWERELQRFVDWLRPTLTDPAPAPAHFSVRSARPTFSAWGWNFAPRRKIGEFTYLADVGADGLTATGSGRLEVLTAPLYAPSATYAVRWSGVTHLVRADTAGRLAFRIGLGPSHTRRQTDFGPSATRGWRRVV